MMLQSAPQPHWLSPSRLERRSCSQMKGHSGKPWLTLTLPCGYPTNEATLTLDD
jgi:hypothetical protein